MEFDALFDDVYPELFRYCHRLTGDPDLADDLTQEAFVRMVERDVAGGREEVRMWLFTVAGNLARDRIRTTERRLRLLLENPPAEHPSGGSPARPDAEAERTERSRVVRAALEELDDRGKRLLLMRAGGFSHREIAEAVGVAFGSVGPLLIRAERALVDALEDRGYDHDSFA